MKKLILASALLSLAVTSAAAEPTLQPIQPSDDVPLYCRDSTGTVQPLLRTNYARLRASFVRQFGWHDAALLATTPSLGTLTFSQDDERIFYDVEVYNGGIALLHMHVRLGGLSQNLSGTEMCWKTFAIVNVH
jgi:hypothetical protein